MYRYRSRRPYGVAILAVLACLAGAGRAAAGGGPQNVMLVVNGRSPGSKQVANHYVRLRNLPASNVVYLDYGGPASWRLPRCFAIRSSGRSWKRSTGRKLSAQIDMIVYSTDFPWRLDFRNDLDVKNQPLPRTSGATVSLTGATYLFAFVQAKSRGLVAMHSNGYLAPVAGQRANRNLGTCQDVARVATRGFRGRYRWALNGTRASKPGEGVRYLMSTMLGGHNRAREHGRRGHPVPRPIRRGGHLAAGGLLRLHAEGGRAAVEAAARVFRRRCGNSCGGSAARRWSNAAPCRRPRSGWPGS